MATKVSPKSRKKSKMPPEFENTKRLNKNYSYDVQADPILEYRKYSPGAFLILSTTGGAYKRGAS